MKFLICLIVFGVCGVFSEEAIPSSSATTVTEAATSSSASSATEAATSSSASTTTEAATAAPVNPIQNIIDQLHKVAKNFQDAILNATKGLGNAANNAVHNASESGVGSEVLKPLTSTITQVVQNAINDISKKSSSGINGLLNSTAQALSEASTKISNLQECANKNGQSPVNITEPLGKLLQCPVNAFTQVSEPVGKGVQLIKQIGESITSEVTGAIKCFQTPIFGWIPNVGCFAGIGIQSLLLGITNASSGFGVASSFGDDIFTLIPNTMDCFNQQWVGIIQTFTKSGVNVAKCLQ
ncbi:mucin-21-like isoform X2 [Chrysoperla carnea]|uniref:mucin-21-like isoform X2 n=1 Tax=Chrysoperla carnea TaxID=189513 RepID=UPI001D05DA49|nr:mucin-21-like isoform X2 [Chrysoperla carnea]